MLFNAQSTITVISGRDHIRRNLLQLHLRIYIEVLFSDYQSDPSRKATYVPMKGVRRRRQQKVALLPSTRINEFHVSDEYVNEKEQCLLVWLNNEMEGDQSILVKSGVIY